MDNLRKKEIRVPFAACKDDEKPYVFMSYAHADRERVFPIFKAVYEAGIDVWYDQGIEINSQYDDVIATHVAECELFVLFISKAAMESDYVVKKEVGFASRSKKRIIPVYIEPTELPHGVNMLLEDATAVPEEELPRVLTKLLAQRCEGWQSKGTRVAKGLTINAAAELVIMDEYEYKPISDGIVLTRYLGNDTDVVIPAEHNGLPVVGLDEAFRENESITTVRIPNSVTSIGEWAFNGCTSLTSITIPDNVTSIGNFAFRNCTSLTSITIPDSVTSICKWAFFDCTALTSITIPDSVTEIGRGAFSVCTSLTSITIPDSVTSISESAFAGCTALTSINVESGNDSYCSIDGVLFNADSTELVRYPEGNRLSHYTIPDKVTSIGNSAFSRCTSLTSITIPDRVTSIGEWAFFDCTALTSATIPDNVTSIGDSAFRDCISLTSITIPDRVTSIGNGAFKGCASLTSITIPNSVTSIGEWAFASSTSLTSIIIPDSVTRIGEDAFDNCPTLTIHGTSGSYAEQYAKENSINFCAIEVTAHEPTQTETPTVSPKPTHAERKAQKQAERLAKKAAKAEAKAAKKAARKGK